MSLYSMFETNEDIEVEGFRLEIVDGENVIAFQIARSGGRNKKFAAALQAAMKPHEMAAQRGKVDDKIAEAILIKCIAKHIVKGWENVVGRGGEEVEYSPEAAEVLLTELPELRDVIWAEANKIANFQVEESAELGES